MPTSNLENISVSVYTYKFISRLDDSLTNASTL